MSNNGASFTDPSSLRLDSLNLSSISQAAPTITYSGNSLNDKRVRISMMPNSPKIFYNDPNNNLLNILASSNGLVFPFQPKVDISYSANYDSTEVIHSNFVFKSYKNSELKAIDLSCNFPVRTPYEGQYVIAAIHFLRCLTMMFTGNDSGEALGAYNLAGAPPLVVSLSGMGFGGLDNIPVSVTNVTASYPDNVDYLTLSIPGLNNGELTKIPAQMVVSVNLQPMFSRAYASAFGLKDFSYGKTRLLGPNPTFPSTGNITTQNSVPTGTTASSNLPNPASGSNNPTYTMTTNVSVSSTFTTIPLQRDTSLDNLVIE